MTPNDARFWAKVAIGTDRECWPWLGRTNQKGYGVAELNGRRSTAHRVAWLRSGRTIATGLVLDHLCRDRLCVNPAHLEPVTNRENLLRGDTLPAKELAKAVCPHGHPLDGVRESRGREHRRCLTCAREDAQRRAAKADR